MTTLKLQAPPGLVAFSDSLGNTYPIGADGTVSFDPTRGNVSALDFLRAGFVAVVPSGTTAQRPAVAYVGQRFFDTTLNLPIWRNSANSGWINASGGAV